MTEIIKSPATERGSVFLDPQISGGPMRLSDLIDGYWAITPGMHDEIRAIYDLHLRGERPDLAAVEARVGRPLEAKRQGYEVRDGGVAVISLSGVISPKANLMTQISGGATAQLLRNDILSAAADPAVKSAVLYADTPGGNVLGVAEAAQAWADFAAVKPAATFSDGTLASAGMWIAAGAPRIYISGPMVNTGSIGVRTEVLDTSMADAAAGRKRTIIAAGRYKAAGDGPMSPEHAAYKQAQVDYLYSLFVDHMAAMRGKPVDQVLADMADGRVFIGAQGIDAGLVDGVMSLEDLLAQMAANPAAVAPLRGRQPGGRGRRTAISQSPQAAAPRAPAAAGAAPAHAQTSSTPAPGADNEGGHMADITTRADIEREYPTLVAEIAAESQAMGAERERARIQAVRATALPGHEALVEKLAFDGKTTPSEAAVAVLAAHRGVLAGASNAHFADAPNAANPGSAPLDERDEGSPQAGGTAGNGKPNKPRMPSLTKAYAALNRAKTTA